MANSPISNGANWLAPRLRPETSQGEYERAVHELSGSDPAERMAALGVLEAFAGARPKRYAERTYDLVLNRITHLISQPQSEAKEETALCVSVLARARKVFDEFHPACSSSPTHDSNLSGPHIVNADWSEALWLPDLFHGSVANVSFGSSESRTSFEGALFLQCDFRDLNFFMVDCQRTVFWLCAFQAPFVGALEETAFFKCKGLDLPSEGDEGSLSLNPPRRKIPDRLVQLDWPAHLQSL